MCEHTDTNMISSVQLFHCYAESTKTFGGLDWNNMNTLKVNDLTANYAHTFCVLHIYIAVLKNQKSVVFSHFLHK